VALSQTTINRLPLLKWKGLIAPYYDVVSFEWEHELASRGVYGVDGEIHEFVRRKSMPFRARMHFCNTLEQGLFPETWEEWKLVLLDGTPGDLVHPGVGP
jgi:hypothetical protein